MHRPVPRPSRRNPPGSPRRRCRRPPRPPGDQFEGNPSVTPAFRPPFSAEGRRDRTRTFVTGPFGSLAYAARKSSARRRTTVVSFPASSPPASTNTVSSSRRRYIEPWGTRFPQAYVRRIPEGGNPPQRYWKKRDTRSRAPRLRESSPNAKVTDTGKYASEGT